MKLVQHREPTARTSWERTEDGQYDVLGDNLDVPVTKNTGPVWTWRPAANTNAVTKNERCFPTKEECLNDLKRRARVLVVCSHCGTRNRRPPSYAGNLARAMGKSVTINCGKCKKELK